MNALSIPNTALKNIEVTRDLFERFVQYSDVKETTLKGYIVCLRQFFKWLQDNDIKTPKREDIKAEIFAWQKEIPTIKANLFGAISRNLW